MKPDSRVDLMGQLFSHFAHPKGPDRRGLMLPHHAPATLDVMATDSQPRLVLWDIDHTLIETRGVGRSIYERVFPTVTGRPLRELATVHGRTELEIMHDTLLAHDIEPNAQTIEHLAAALADGYRNATDALTAQGRVLPGVWQALRTLADETGTHQSVLTGNTTEVARIKIEAYGLDRYIDPSLGAYGDDHRDRGELVNIACERATRQLGSAVTPGNVALVGDTPNDVAAALAAGSRVVAVASGKYSVDDLRAAGATVTLGTLEDVSELRQTIENHHQVDVRR